MPKLDAGYRFTEEILAVSSEDALTDILAEACAIMGCSWFALSQHVDFMARPHKAVRVHNYPEEWARWFDEHGLGLNDPVHRASQRRAAGFLWRDMKRFSRPRRGDRAILARARQHGIYDGLTVPTHIPGEAHGSVSFGWQRGSDPTPEALHFAQSIGAFLFEAARQLSDSGAANDQPRLTDRQIECLLWAARGKSDSAIGQIMNLRTDTVSEHLRNARGRYDARSRISLAIRALFDGTICFGDVAKG
jgi:LuxR family quorum-sensing system transcriptional regulator CciR